MWLHADLSLITVTSTRLYCTVWEAEAVTAKDWLREAGAQSWMPILSFPCRTSNKLLLSTTNHTAKQGDQYVMIQPHIRFFMGQARHTLLFYSIRAFQPQQGSKRGEADLE